MIYKNKWAGPTRKNAAAFLIFLAYSGIFLYWSVTGWRGPLMNWDVIPYTAAALEQRVPSDRLRHATFADLQQFSSGQVVKLHTSAYTQAVAENDHYFRSQLPFYKVKPLYVGLTRWLGDLTGSYARATVGISAASFFLYGMAIWLLKPAGLSALVWASLTLALTSIAVPVSFTRLASASTPDTLAAALFLWGCVFVLKARWAQVATVLWMGAVWARPDYIVFIAAFLPYLACQFHLGKQGPAVFCTLGLPWAAYLVTQVLWPNYSLSNLMAHTFLGPFPDPGALSNPPMSAGLYLEKLSQNVVWMFQVGRPAFFLTVGVVCVFVLPTRMALIALAAVLGILSKIVLFPNIDAGNQERYYFASYTLICMTGVALGPMLMFSFRQMARGAVESRSRCTKNRRHPLAGRAP